MQLFINQLLKGIIYSIDQVVLPGLASPYLKAQAIAISSSLTNLTTRLAVLDRILWDQNRLLTDLFQRLEKILNSSHELSQDEISVRVRQKIEGQTAKKYTTEQPITAENHDLKSLLEEVVEGLWEIEDRVTDQSLREVHDEIRQFLKHEVETELSLLTPPDMGRVSKG